MYFRIFELLHFKNTYRRLNLTKYKLPLKKILTRTPRMPLNDPTHQTQNYNRKKISVPAANGPESTNAARGPRAQCTRRNTHPARASTPTAARSCATRSPCCRSARSRPGSSGSTTSTRRPKRSSWSWNSESTLLYE